jgi:hypothetical protein
MHATNETALSPEYASPEEFAAFVDELNARLDGARPIESTRPQTALDAAQIRNARRNLNLEMIRLMENGARFDSPAVSQLRAALRALPDPNA